MYDIIVVGARCAGSAVALLLARKGYKVLLVDRSAFPSDLPFSTHYIHQDGVARLKKWGVLDEVVRSGCPAISHFYFDFGTFALTGTPPPADGVHEAYAPRRIVLDPILVDAAVASGAELRAEFSVEGLLFDGEAVCGIRGRQKGGSLFEEKARLVIGADGMHSAVAKAVGAAQYNVKPPLQGPYFTYWSGVQMKGFEFYPRDYRGVFGWMTNDGLALIGVAFTAKDHPAMRADVEGNYQRAIAEDAPGLAERMREGHREERFIGGLVPSYFRKPFGQGWALVGDAGYLKDPCTAEGITDAFHSAESLAKAIDSGLSGRQPIDHALALYEEERNKRAFPLFEFTCQLATLAPPTPEMQQLFMALRGNQEQTNRFFGIFAQTVTVPEFFAPENMQKIFGGTRHTTA